MIRTRFRFLVVPLVVLLGGALLSACDADEPEARQESRQVREDVREVLTDLEEALREQDFPEQKEQLLRRCVAALERLRDANDAQADRLASFCDSLEVTNPNTPAAWDDIRARLNELIRQFSG